MATTDSTKPAVPYPKALEEFPTLRQSLLGQFDQCALTTKFDLEFSRGWSSHEQARGIIFHRFAAAALEEMALHGEESIEVDVALAILHEKLRQADVDEFCHQPGCGLPTEIKPADDGRVVVCKDGHRHHSSVVNVPMSEIKDLYWMVKKWAHDNTFDIASLAEVEQRLEATVSYPNPHGGRVERRLTGRLDALFIKGEEADHAVIPDWKTGWSMPGPTDISFEGYFQQRFYAWLVMRHYRSVQKVTLREYYVRFSEPREATVWREQLEDIGEELASLAERFDQAYERDVWMPTPGKACQWCVRPAACPIPTFARDEGAVRDSETARKVANRLVVAEVAAKQAKVALQGYADVHGPIPVKNPDGHGRMVWGYKAGERTKSPKPEDIEKEIAVAAAEHRKPDVEGLWKTSKSTTFKKHVPTDEPIPEEDGALLAKLEASVKDAQEHKKMSKKERKKL